ncbi:MAG TPA: hypothetical protein VHI14_05685 [Jatrophihabitantaceae bacterium]|jgi:hypothetical protein|nr:hypothetical protein [Jatrophihabitantaceae bacterium]
MEMTNSTETFEAAKVWTSAPAVPQVTSVLVDPRSAAFEGTRVPSGPQTIPAVAAIDAVLSMQNAGGVPPRGAPR